MWEQGAEGRREGPARGRKGCYSPQMLIGHEIDWVWIAFQRLGMTHFIVSKET